MMAGDLRWMGVGVSAASSAMALAHAALPSLPEVDLGYRLVTAEWRSRT